MLLDNHFLMISLAMTLRMNPPSQFQGTLHTPRLFKKIQGTLVLVALLKPSRGQEMSNMLKLK